MKKLLAVLFVCALTLIGCVFMPPDGSGGDGSGGEKTQPTGIYVLSEISENAVNTTSNYVYKTVTVLKGKVTERALSTFGGVKVTEKDLAFTDGVYSDSEAMTYVFEKKQSYCTKGCL